MSVPPLVWAFTIAGILAIIAADLFLIHRNDTREFTTRRAAFWSTVYIGLAALFGLGVWAFSGGEHAAEYFGGFVTEKSLSVDNLFVFMVILTRFAVPKHAQHTVLMAGIVIALVLRGIFIAVGAAAIATFTWVFFIFGAFLIWTAIGLVRGGDEDEFKENALLRWAKRVIPTSDEYDGSRFVTRRSGRRLVTPMAIVMIAIGSTDVLFALDSIPAIFGLTTEPYLVFTANAFALMGLVQLYFLLGGLTDRLVYLGHGLAFILGFIGVKLIFHALHEYGVGWAPEVPIWLSLAVIAGTLAATTVASLAAGPKRSGGKPAVTGPAAEPAAETTRDG
ncbi:TerC family protein [Actinomadura madurae]|uniref:TerC family protein n=1 Tax=Actinomadura madurae TaxID=1993 RepID=UPI00202642FE|nr:TerC family protein [Actinomadura madurae]MCP9948005.1 TerC family protein [Actinomadura madurae]MCP9977257.1 TerC family protein [Actinomadura madurae]MCQ0013445.1 TerC family protein [Actinomadura madurae]URM93668.1 TerC family protein [Actinomadura madurae]URN04391.1 TerC family protein [Actinomadura madurae]